MYKIETNIHEVALEVTKFINLSDDKGRVALEIAVYDAVALVSNRIQKIGESVSGSSMKNKGSVQKIGAYGFTHGTARKKRGLQTEHVDLTFTGDMMRAFQVLDVSGSEASAGFLSERESDKAGYMEDYYGEIFGLSDGEQTHIANVIVNELLK